MNDRIGWQTDWLFRAGRHGALTGPAMKAYDGNRGVEVLASKACLGSAESVSIMMTPHVRSHIPALELSADERHHLAAKVPACRDLQTSRLFTTPAQGAFTRCGLASSAPRTSGRSAPGRYKNLHFALPFPQACSLTTTTAPGAGQRKEPSLSRIRRYPAHTGGGIEGQIVSTVS